MDRLQNIHFINYLVECKTCGGLYNPSDDMEIKEILNVSPLTANVFCSRKCFDNYQILVEFRSTL